MTTNHWETKRKRRTNSIC